MLDDPKQSRIATLVGIGVALMFFGATGFGLMYTQGVLRAVSSRGRDMSPFVFSSAAAVAFLAGLVMVAAGLVMGAREAFGDRTKKAMERGGPVYVVACLVTDKKHEPVFDPEMYDEEDLRYYVQVKYPDGNSREFETAPEVQASVGEGMWGHITYQGDWLCSFERLMPG